MTRHTENKTIEDAVELLKTNGFDAMADAVTALMNSAMLAERSKYLGAAPYKRCATRVGHANGCKDKTVKARVGELSLSVPQTSDGGFYPQSLERGLHSERALLLSIAEMYVQGVSTLRIKKIVEELCGMEVSSTQVSRAAAQLDEILAAWRTRESCEYRYVNWDARFGYLKRRRTGAHFSAISNSGGCTAPP